IFSTLKILYSDPRRTYHNLKHIHDCLVMLDNTPVPNDIDDSDIKLAIWFHDCIYTFSPGHDEEMSQKFFLALMQKYNRKIKLSKIVHMISLTDGHTNLKKQEYSSAVLKPENIFIDIDLSILGSKPDVYNKYCESIISE